MLSSCGRLWKFGHQSHALLNTKATAITSRIERDRVVYDISYRFNTTVVKRMDASQKYLFDTAGYVIIRKVFNEEEVNTANEAIDKHIDTLHERTGPLRCSTLYGKKIGEDF